MIPNVLSIAGSDPSGGAGVQADIKTISANGGYAMAVITALTAQNTQGVFAVEMVSTAMIVAQLTALRTDIRIDAIKIGMLGTSEIIQAVEKALHGYCAPIILDPVMVAKSGDRLLAAEASFALRKLLPMARVITPNLPEAADLLGCQEATTRAQMQDQACSLLAMGAGAVLLKGGHLPGDTCPDVLVEPTCLTWFDGPRQTTTQTHGTGCTLSSALATFISLGLPLPDATRRAKAYVRDAIAWASVLSVGHGHGPTHHFHAHF